MAALEVIAGLVTAPSTTQTALTMHTSGSNQIRNMEANAKALLLQCWTDNQTAGILRIKSPNLHDDVHGLRLRANASDVEPLLPWGMAQPLVPQDSLTIDLSGSGTSGDIETAALLIYYPQLPGIAARLLTAEDVKNRMVHIMAVENTLALGTSGGFSGEEAINAEYDQFKANTDYAILGYVVSAECALIGYRGSDTGNLRVAGPGNETDQELTANWFVNLSMRYNLPLVPVFNSANKNSFLVDGSQDENGTDVLVTTILAELSS